MKKVLLLSMICAAVFFSGCSKDDQVVEAPVITENVGTEKLEANIPELVGLVGKDLDQVKAALSRYSFKVSGKAGNRKVTVSGINGDKVLAIQLIESSNKVITEVLVNYEGIPNSAPINSIFETDLWYAFFAKLQTAFNQATEMVYIKTDTKTFTSNDEFIAYFRANGGLGVAFTAKWNVKTAVITNTIDKAGKFYLQIKAK